MKSSSVYAFSILVIPLLLASICSVSLQGQELSPNKQGLSFVFGASHYRLIDESLTHARLKFTGTGFSSSISYENQSIKRRLSGNIQFGTGTMRHQLSDLSIQLYDLQLELSYQSKIASYKLFGHEATLFLGPQLSLLDYVLRDEEVLENVTVSFTHALRAILTQELLINSKSSLGLSWSIPVFGFVKREAYDGGANTELEDDLLNKLGSFFFGDGEGQLLTPLNLSNLNIGYVYTPSGKNSLSLHYQLNWLNLEDGDPIRLYGNSLLLGLQFRL